MTFVVVHESMFGNTRMIADAIADTLRAEGHDVRQLPAAGLSDVTFEVDDVLVLGAPTHAHTLPGERSRAAASHIAVKSDPPLALEPTAAAAGIREWLRDGTEFPTQAAVFDTRAKGPRMLTGSAAVRIARHLHRRQTRLLVPAESFFVDGNSLIEGEVDRARSWAKTVAAQRPAPRSAVYG